MKLNLRGLCLSAVALVGALASAQDRGTRFDYLALEIGAFYPTSGEVRDAFDVPVLRIGITPIMVRRTRDWRPSFELGYIGARSDDDRFAIYPLTIGAQKSFGDPDQQTTPYVRAGAGLAYFDFDMNGNDEKGLGATTVLEGGFMAGDRFKASVRYYLFPERDGINFSGYLFSASYGLIRL